ncbi:hypothetical protein MMC08_007137 [Hypocenomyce scalaris]|nr:hypothetical protein [Hypocenomyce scalaris]
MIPGERWGSLRFANNTNESGRYEPVGGERASPGEGLAMAGTGTGPWSPSSLNPRPEMGELHDESLPPPLSTMSTGTVTPMGTPNLDSPGPTSRAGTPTARHVLEEHKTASTINHVENPVSEIADFQTQSPKAQPQHLSVPVSEMSQASSPRQSSLPNPHSSMPISELSSVSDPRPLETQGNAVSIANNRISAQGGSGKYVSPEMALVGGWWDGSGDRNGEGSEELGREEDSS